MKNLYISVLSVLFLSCIGRGTGTDNARTERTAHPDPQLIVSLSPAAGERFRTGDQVLLLVRLAGGADSVAIYINGRRRIAENGELLYKITPSANVGRVPWRAAAYLAGDSTVRYSEIVVYPSEPPREYGYRVINSYPHDTDSYTQGLLWHDGFLYESTGLEGRSALMKVQLEDGKIIRRKEMNPQYFGEGLAMIGGKLYQLTWQDGTGLVYDPDSFEQVGQFGYDGEGWGLASDGERLYMSDGTEKIKVIDPGTFRVERIISVYTDRAALPYINELEWIEGELWANVYTTSQIARIDPLSGRVTGVIDLAGILPEEEITMDTDVLNGIAFDPESGRIFVTGKNWSRLFEIEVFEK